MSTSKKQTKKTLIDLPKWALIALLTAIAVYLTNEKTVIPSSLQAIVWIIWLALSLSILYFTQLGKQGFEFAKDAKQELLKVVWPSRQETVQMTLVIMVVVLIVSLMLWAVDSSLIWLVGKLTNLK